MACFSEEKDRKDLWGSNFPCDAEGCFRASLWSGVFPEVGIYDYGPRILALEIGHSKGADRPIESKLRDPSLEVTVNL